MSNTSIGAQTTWTMHRAHILPNGWGADCGFDDCIVSTCAFTIGRVVVIPNSTSVRVIDGVCFGMQVFGDGMES